MTPLTDFFPPLGGALQPQSISSAWIRIPSGLFPPQTIAFPLLLHDTQTADILSQLKPHCFWIPCPLLTPPFPKKSTPYQISPRPMNPTDSFACPHAPPTPFVSPLPDGTLSVTQPKSISTLLKPVLEKSSPDSPSELSTCVSTCNGARSLQTYQFQTSLCGKLRPWTCSSQHYHTLIFSESMFPSTLSTYLWETLFQSTRRPIAILSLAFTSVDSRRDK